MSGLFGGIVKPGDASRIALVRELEARRDQWKPRPGDAFRGGGDLLLLHGTFFCGRPLPDQYADAFGEPNACFNNTLVAVRAHPELRYFEGVYAAHGGFVAHAWAVAPDGGVVETTWPTRPDQGTERSVDSIMRMGLVAPERMAYCGVELHPDLVESFFLHYGGGLCLLDRSAHDVQSGTAAGLDMSQPHDFEILRHPYDPKRTEFPDGAA